MKKIILFLLPVFLYLLPAEACSCADYTKQHFCDFIDYPEIIIRAEITNRKNGLITAKVDEVLSGIYTDNKIDFLESIFFCGPYIPEDLGNHFIFGLKKNEDLPDLKASYYNPPCGIYFLPIENGKVKGRITPGKSTMSLPNFRELLSSASCKASGTQISSVWDGSRIQLSDPFGQYNGELKVSVKDMMGRTVINYNIRMKDGKLEDQAIPLIHLPTAIYLICVEAEGQIASVNKVFMQGN